MKKIIVFLLAVTFIFLTGCGSGRRVEDTRVLTDAEFTFYSTVSTDVYGRKVTAIKGDKKDKDNRDVGIFYLLWHGMYGTQSTTYNITEIEALGEDDKAELFNWESTKYPKEKFYYWGEPLYGYYNSRDEWVVRRHVELFISAGVDFLGIDFTNGYSYDKEFLLLCKVLKEYQDQGFDVPKVMPMCSNDTAGIKSTVLVEHFYKTFYTNPEYEEYESVWYCPNEEGKPMICGYPSWGEGWKGKEYIRDFFDYRTFQWQEEQANEDGFPWIDYRFYYPAQVFIDVAAISVAQHNAGPMSLFANGGGNHGRGYDQYLLEDYRDDFRRGQNFESEWQGIAQIDAENKDFTTVFIDGWNEWGALKLFAMDSVIFTDTYTEEYSRDMEMMKGGYGDNFYLQLARNARNFKYEQAESYKWQQYTIDINGDDSQWDEVKYTYLDPAGDAVQRDCVGAFNDQKYFDDSNRNDIVSIKVASDSKNMYFRIETKDDITERADGDKGWMNLYIGSNDSKTSKWETYDYVINRSSGQGTAAVEKNVDGSYNWRNCGNADMRYEGNVMYVKVPLKLIGGSSDIVFKVTDNVNKDVDDIMSYYVYGDAAPIGRQSYAYGY